jgi:hypothetical protein
MQLKEDFLHYIWQYRLLNTRNLYCNQGQQLQIIHPGTLNPNAGPDFSLAKLEIGGQLWAGNIEIHVKSSDWLLHQHNKDPAYDTVILHAVYENDAVVTRTDGSLIPTLLLKGLVPEQLLENYLELIANRNFFPCIRQIAGVDQSVFQQVLDQNVEDRLLEKCRGLSQKMELNKNHWNESFYYLLLRNFGFKVNAVPFELLADALPSILLAKHRDNPLQVAALLFGQAGFLESDFTDKYPQQLKAEYRFLQKKYQLRPIERSVWKFLRMHPQNFPLLRIAQLVALIVHHSAIFSLILKENSFKGLKAIFGGIVVHPYWQNHTHFDQLSKPISTRLGVKSVESLLINTVCILLYSYGDYFARPAYKDSALELLRQIPAERNAILDPYRKSGLQLKNAYATQGILQLYKNGCSLKKCLSCGIGLEIIGS